MMAVKTLGYVGETIEFWVYEDDPVAVLPIDPDDLAEKVCQTAVVQDAWDDSVECFVVKCEWTQICGDNEDYCIDGWFGGNPEFYFVVHLAGEEIKSWNSLVVQMP